MNEKTIICLIANVYFFQFVSCQTLHGHEDWIRGLSFTTASKYHNIETLLSTAYLTFHETATHSIMWQRHLACDMWRLINFVPLDTDNGDLLLASCAQDCYIRIWRISPRDPDTLATNYTISQLSLDDDIKLKEDTFSFGFNGKLNAHGG